MKKFYVRNIMEKLLGLVILMIVFLGGLYAVSWMVELIAINVNPEIITIACVGLATLLINSQC